MQKSYLKKQRLEKERALEQEHATSQYERLEEDLKSHQDRIERLEKSLRKSESSIREALTRASDAEEALQVSFGACYITNTSPDCKERRDTCSSEARLANICS